MRSNFRRVTIPLILIQIPRFRRPDALDHEDCDDEFLVSKNSKSKDDES